MKQGTLQHSKKLLTSIFAALLFFAIVYRIPVKQGEVRVSFMVIMEIALTVSLSAVLWHYSKPVALFLIMSMVSMFYPVYGPHSFYAQKMVFLGCLWFFLLVHFVNDVDLFLDALCYGALINLVVQIIHAIFIPLGIPFFVSSPMPVGLMANPNEASALYVFCFIAFFSSGWLKGIRMVGIPLMLVGLYLSNSKMAAVCLAFGFILWLFYCTLFGSKHNQYAYICLISLIFGLMFFILCVPMDSLCLRLKVWIFTFPILAKHWIMGAGIGHWKVLFQGPMPFDNLRWDMAHNEYYQLWAEMGIIPIGLVVAYFIGIINEFRKEFIFTYIAIGMIAVNCVGNFAFHIAPLAMIAITWMAIQKIQLRGNLCLQKIA